MKNPGIIVFAVVSIWAAGVRGQSRDRGASGIESPSEFGRAPSISEAARSVAAGDVIGSEKISSRAVPAESKELEYDFDIPLPSKRAYYQTIELVRISWPVMMSQHTDEFGSKLIIGLNRPQYRLKKDIRVIGSFDLKFDNILFGLANSARITFRYDVKKPHNDNRSRVKLLVDGAAFTVRIPLPAVPK